MFSRTTLVDRRSELLSNIRLLIANGYSIFLNGADVRDEVIRQYRAEVAAIDALLRKPAPIG